MNDKQYGAKDRFTSQEHEDALRTAWSKLDKEIADTPAPNILPVLTARLNAARRKPVRQPGYFASPFKVGATIAAIGAIALFARMQNTPTTPYIAPTTSSDSLPADHTSLAVMLTEVRWRSSDERKVHREPPSYNEETRALLLSEKGEGK